MSFPLLLLLRDKKYLAITVLIAGTLFSFEYYLMATLPGAKDNQCIVGGFLTPLNVTFGLSSSLLMGLMVSGIVSMISKNRGGAAVATSLGGFSTVVGILTTFCTLCTLPVLTFFGLSLGLEIFTTHNLAFKLISVTLLLIGLFLLNNQLGQQCRFCVVPTKAKRKTVTDNVPSPLRENTFMQI